VEIRRFEKGDRGQVEALMDAFGDEIAAMDPHGRCTREPGYGAEFVRQMLEDASGRRHRVSCGGERPHRGLRQRANRDKAGTRSSGRSSTSETGLSWNFTGLHGGAVEGWGARCSRDSTSTSVCGAAKHPLIEVFAPNVRARDFYSRRGYEVVV
jgi:hypothetical protein